MPLRRRPARADDLGGGGDAQAEQHPDRVDLPAWSPTSSIRPGAVHEAAVVQLCLEFGLVELAMAHPSEHANDADQDHQVQDAQDPQKGPGHGRSDGAGNRVQLGTVVLHLARQGAHAEDSSKVSAKTIVEWPSENQNPTDSGFRPGLSANSFRVVLSTVAMWSASNAWGSASVYASTP